MQTLSITVSDELRAAAEQAVASGRFATVSEYIATLIRQDQQREDEQTEAHLLQRVQAGPRLISPTPTSIASDSGSMPRSPEGANREPITQPRWR